SDACFFISPSCHKCNSFSGLDKAGPSEQNSKRRIKSEHASAAPVCQPRRSLKSSRGILCLPQWFPLRRPWAALLSLTLTRILRCVRAFFNQQSKISNQKYLR